MNAAGNSGQRHWSGTFTDTNADRFNEFTPGDELDRITVANGSQACAFLKWDAMNCSSTAVTDSIAASG